MTQRWKYAKDLQPGDRISIPIHGFTTQFAIFSSVQHSIGLVHYWKLIGATADGTIIDTTASQYEHIRIIKALRD